MLTMMWGSWGLNLRTTAGHMKAWLHQTFASMTPRASNVPGGRRLLSLTLAILITLPGCTLLPMKTLKPIIAPPALSLCPKSPTEQQNTAEQIGETDIFCQAMTARVHSEPRTKRPPAVLMTTGKRLKIGSILNYLSTWLRTTSQLYFVIF